jgi:hypothetical protein
MSSELISSYFRFGALAAGNIGQSVFANVLADTGEMP